MLSDLTSIMSNKLLFINNLITRIELRELMHSAFESYGSAKAAVLVDLLKNLGFQSASQASFSISLEDLYITETKSRLQGLAIHELSNSDAK